MLGGVAIYIGIVIPALALGHHHGFWGIMLGATLMLGLGLLDDIHSLHPGVKMEITENTYKKLAVKTQP